MAGTGALLVGVDGGGTHCRVRIVMPDGTVVGEAQGGSANVFTDLDGSLETVEVVVTEALRRGGLSRADLARCRVGLGLAGANIPNVAGRLSQRTLPFAGYILASDATTACLGAHRGRDGGLAILGTGSAYVALKGGTATIFGGWGSAVSDHGSGADIGRAALVAALLAHDRVGASSPLTDAVLAAFDGDPAAISSFAAGARPRDFGRFAPLAFDRADENDPVALAIVGRALAIIEASLARLLELGVDRIAVVGGAAERYHGRLSPDLRAHLAEPLGTALDGALILARRLLDQ